jgi:hypothetical protein
MSNANQKKTLASSFEDGTTHPSQICFHNLSEDIITVFWIDYKGDKQKYSTISPGKLASQSKENDRRGFLQSARPWSSPKRGVAGGCCKAYTSSGFDMQTASPLTCGVWNMVGVMLSNC